MPASYSFNPYVTPPENKTFTLGDILDSSPNVTAQIKLPDGNVVRDLVAGTRPTGSVTITWDGTNNNNDYVNEGTYTLSVTATDGAGNPTSSSVSVRVVDDQRLTSFNSSPGATNPSLSSAGSTLSLTYINGYTDHQTSGRARVETGWFGWGESDYWFDVDHTHAVTVSSAAGDFTTSGHWLYDASGAQLWVSGDRGRSAILTLNAGRYRTKARASTSYSNGWAETWATWNDRKYNQYVDQSTSAGSSWSRSSGPSEVDNIPRQTPRNLNGWGIGSRTFDTKIEGGNLHFRRGVVRNGFWLWFHGLWVSTEIDWTSWVRLTNSGTAGNPMVLDAGDGVFYIAWEDTRNGYPEIYFQRVPSNFAPFYGTTTITTASLAGIAPTQSGSLTAPKLISPKNADTVKTTRPTFQWLGVGQNADDFRNYQIELSQGGEAGTPGNLGIITRPLTKTFTADELSNIGTDEATGNSGPVLSYTILEFDGGLDQGEWFWRVTANPGLGTAATSEVASFTINPPLTITGVTNYPNPFNPNAQSTKIRYRLSQDADVIIRIYDITGALVWEKNFSPGFNGGKGEGNSVFEKYNDVDWDGQNGRGDRVVNGIYPFEVVATSGGNTVRGRGKVAVLK